MFTASAKPSLALSRSKQVALQELPEDATVLVFTCAAKDHQFAPQLKAGTAAKARVDFGDQVGARRLLTGDLLVVLAQIGEAHVCREITDHTHAELLVLTRNTRPLTDFQTA